MKYTVIGNIKRDNKTLKVGSTVDFDDDEAAHLLRDGYIADGAASDDSKDSGKSGGKGK